MAAAAAARAPRGPQEALDSRRTPLWPTKWLPEGEELSARALLLLLLSLGGKNNNSARYERARAGGQPASRARMSHRRRLRRR